jgi:hypothetical protein
LKRFALKTLAFLAVSAAVLAEPAANPVGEIVDRYVSATQAQRGSLRGIGMEVEIDASLPKLKKQGRMHAFRSISRIGEITYRALRFDGDNTIRKDVIARYLAAEVAAREGGTSMAVTPENYRFKYKASIEQGGKKMHVLRVEPKKKRVGLFKGEIWIDGETFLLVRESGTFVKNPSVFLKKVEFVRDYEIRDGIAFPRHLESKVQTRLVGAAQINIDFSNFTREEDHARAVPACDVQ